MTLTESLGMQKHFFHSSTPKCFKDITRKDYLIVENEENFPMGPQIFVFFGATGFCNKGVHTLNLLGTLIQRSHLLDLSLGRVHMEKKAPQNLLREKDATGVMFLTA